MCQSPADPHWETDALSDDQQLAMRGGLRGRLAEEFCVLQCELDALVHCVERDGALTARATVLSLLDKMTSRIQRLERLSDHAADLALGVALRRQRQRMTLDLVRYLQDFCQIANEELAACGSALRIIFETEEDRRWIETDERLMDGVLANLFSNAAAAGASSVSLKLNANCLTYQDNGPGPAPAVRALLREGTMEKDLLAQGGTGILIVREYADAIQWTLFLPEEKATGLLLGFRLPEWRREEDGLVLQDDSVEQILRERCQRATLQREFVTLRADTER